MSQGNTENIKRISKNGAYSKGYIDGLVSKFKAGSVNTDYREDYKQGFLVGKSMCLNGIGG